VIEALGERYRALAPDIRGHGAASARRPVTLEAVLSDLRAIAPARFSLAGYSMGGRIALHGALAMPERVERLVLIGASPGLADEEERRARRGSDASLADEIEASTIEEFAERWARTPALEGQSPAVARAAREDRLRSTTEGLALALRGLGAATLPPLWDRLGELHPDVLLIAGERDLKFRRLGEQMAALIPSARLEVVAGAGHAVHLERPDEVARLLAG